MGVRRVENGVENGVGVRGVEKWSAGVYGIVVQSGVRKKERWHTCVGSM